MRNKIIYILSAATILFAAGCKKSELDIKNPNNPDNASAASETGIVALSLGAVYQNGFNGISDSRYTGSWLGSTYWFLAPAYKDLLADVISAEAANNITNQVGVPDYVILDNGAKTTNTAPSKTVVRVNNSRTKAGLNMFYFEWTWMYFMNNACNNVLQVLNTVPTFTGDSASKKNAIRAWAYFWKGFAYAHIGSTYYAGLVKSDFILVSNEYKAASDIIAESNANFNKAIAALNAVTSVADYNTILKGLIPSQNQLGKGGVMTPAMWIRNINTMLARNLLVNKRLSAMTSADWNAVLTLANNGITKDDLVFTSRSASTGGYMSATSGTVAALTTGDPTGTTYKISERLIQDYPSGDKRLTNNFIITPTYLNQKGGFTYSTRYRLLDSGGATKTYTTASVTSKVVNQYELYIAGTYEENELMKAEANIKLGNIATGLASVDAVRTYQNAGIPAVSGVVISAAGAYEELRKERRVGLLFRDGLSFYDARRWGVLDDISSGGGRTGCVVVSTTGVLNTNATINYNFLDYWDVPDDETALNAPSATSAPVKNPK